MVRLHRRGDRLIDHALPQAGIRHLGDAIGHTGAAQAARCSVMEPHQARYKVAQLR